MCKVEQTNLSISLINHTFDLIDTLGNKKIYCDTQLSLLKYEKSLLLDKMLLLNYSDKDFICLGRIELAIKYLERKSNSCIINDFDN
jgi:hypothetical protein